MYWYRDIVTKSVVVKNIDSEKEDDIRQPCYQRYRTRLQEERRVRGGELGWPGEQSGDEELAEGD